MDLGQHLFPRALAKGLDGTDEKVDQETDQRQNRNEYDAERHQEKRVGPLQNVTRREENKEDDDGSRHDERYLHHAQNRIIRKEEEKRIEERPKYGEHLHGKDGKYSSGVFVTPFTGRRIPTI